MILPSDALMPVIRDALERGQRVRMTVTGSSMWPFVRDGDVVELEPAPAPRSGDMVLVQTNPQGSADRYVLHRVVKVDRGAGFFVRGDAQPNAEGPFAPAALLGRVTTVRHNGRARDHRRGFWRLIGLVWIPCSRFGLWPLRLVARIRRLGVTAARRFRRNDAAPSNPMPDRSQDCVRLTGLLSGRAINAGAYSEEDWQHLVDLAGRQGVAPLLHARLKERDITPPSVPAERLRRIYFATLGRNLLIFRELADTLRALQAASIPAIPLKGACLAEAIYGNIGLRQMGDVDLLVRLADLRRTLDVLWTLGYAAAHPVGIETVRQNSQHMPPMVKRGAVPLELHWTIVGPQYDLPFDDNDLGQLWGRATPVTIGGVPVLTLSPADMLLHLCFHASVQHRFLGIGLRAFLDIDQVVRHCGADLNWEQFTRHANQWGIANGVFLTLLLAQEWTDVVIPPSVMRSLEHSAPDDATLAWVRHKILNETPRAVSGNVAGMGKERVSGRLATVYAALFPSRHAMAGMYPAPANSWRILCYYPVRFRDVWMRHAAAMWRLLWRDRELSAAVRQESRLRDYLASH